jgi:hypothetical protein
MRDYPETIKDIIIPVYGAWKEAQTMKRMEFKHSAMIIHAYLKEQEISNFLIMPAFDRIKNMAGDIHSRNATKAAVIRNYHMFESELKHMINSCNREFGTCYRNDHVDAMYLNSEIYKLIKG